MRFWFWALAIGIVLLDRVTKIAVLRSLPEHHPPVPVIPGVVSFTHVRNPGSAFGLLPEGGAFLIAVGVFAVIFLIICWNAIRRREGRVHPLLTVGLALPLGGAAGNLIDRALYREVIDFIDLHFWPVFNVADSAITVGVVLAAWYLFFVHERE